MRYISMLGLWHFFNGITSKDITIFTANTLLTYWGRIGMIKSKSSKILGTNSILWRAEANSHRQEKATDGT
jgi:hypothetical protein